MPIDAGDETCALLGALPILISAATATVARSTPDFGSRPIIRLELDADERALISEIHDASDWVFTVDRNMGIEFFDHGGRRDRPDYLIDYTPATVPEHGHRLVAGTVTCIQNEYAPYSDTLPCQQTSWSSWLRAPETGAAFVTK